MESDISQDKDEALPTCKGRTGKYRNGTCTYFFCHPMTFCEDVQKASLTNITRKDLIFSMW